VTIQGNWSSDGRRLKRDNLRRGRRLQNRSAVQGQSESRQHVIAKVKETECRLSRLAVTRSQLCMVLFHINRSICAGFMTLGKLYGDQNLRTVGDPFDPWAGGSNVCNLGVFRCECFSLFLLRLLFDRHDDHRLYSVDNKNGLYLPPDSTSKLFLQTLFQDSISRSETM